MKPSGNRIGILAARGSPPDTPGYPTPSSAVERVFASCAAAWRRIGKRRGIAIAFTALALAGCDRAETLRYRLTVEVDTPQGLRTGSSVIEVDVREQQGEYILGNRVRLRARGEAAAVDLPGGRVLFALLRDGVMSDAAKVYPWRAFNPPRGDGHEWGIHAARALKQIEQPGEIPPRYYPLLVTFGDLSDPMTVKRVDPSNLSASFGPGVSLKAITVQMTEDPVSAVIAKRLGWLNIYHDKMLDGQRLNSLEARNRIANDLTQSDFAIVTLK